ncbi:hypothetical protein NDU88_005522 [Pleurodeles waltl]|uniref:RNase H type-1 domain-containing protein n=1 Tax=Pleurodeles waltl TaxID=8319 RepID=A0AAV7NQI5_PLEWA|nr:hypothetical protein NDU88_005522 [Pleurodeles waltl]
MAVGGVGIPAAVQQAAPPRRIQWGRGTLAGPRQWCRSDRGFTAAVGIPIGALPACRRCSRGPPPWRSKTARHTFTQTLGDFTAQLAELKDLVMALEHTDPAQLTLIVCDSYYCVQAFNEYLHYWHQNGFRDSKGNTIKHRLLWGKVADLKKMLPNVHVVHTLGHQCIGIHIAGNTLADEAAKSAVATATVAAVTRLCAKLDDDIWAAVKATAECTPYPKAFPAKYSYQMGGCLNAESSNAFLDLYGPGVEAAESPLDINERVTVLQELQQFHDDNASASAFSTGIKDVPVTPTGWIPKVGDLVLEKVTVKKEFGPSYRAPVPVLGIHGTRTVILPPLAGVKENRFVSIDNVKLHHVADPAQQTKRNSQ